MMRSQIKFGSLLVAGAFLLLACASAPHSAKQQEDNQGKVIVKLQTGDQKNSQTVAKLTPDKLANIINAVYKKEIEEANGLFELGEQAVNRDDNAAGLDFFEKALACYKKIPNSEFNQACCQVGIGAAQAELGKNEDALKNLEQALAVIKQFKGKEELITQLDNSIEAIKVKMGGQPQAGASIKPLTSSDPQQTREQAKTFFYQGGRAANNKDWTASLGAYTKALSLFKTLKGTEKEQGACYGGIGLALYGMGKVAESLQPLEQAQALFNATGSTNELKSVSQLIQIIKASQSAAADSPPSFEKGMGLMLRAEQASKTGDQAEAMDAYAEALAIMKTLNGTEREQACCHGGMALAQYKMGKKEESIPFMEKALELFKIKGTQEQQQSAQEFIDGVKKEIQQAKTRSVSDYP